MMEAAVAHEASKNALRQCLALLQGPSDEHKFAGLVMVTKHVPALKQGEAAAVMTAVMQAVGPLFLQRLLRTKAEAGISMYQQIAAGILAATCQSPALIVNSVRPHTHDLVQLLRAARGSQLLDDLTTCMCALSSTSEGLEALSRAQAPIVICHRLQQCTESAAPFTAHESSLFLCLERLLEHIRERCLTSADVHSLAFTFAKDKTPRAAAALRVLLLWATLAAHSTDAAEFASGATAANLREGLLQSLHGAATESISDAALALLATLLQALGQRWAVEDAAALSAAVTANGSPPTAAATARKMRASRGAFVQFVVRAAGGEVRILLDEALAVLLPADTTPIEAKGQVSEQV
jgi:Neurochondrin